MGNQNSSKGNSASEVEQKIVLRLRNRDIILHYSFKMKLHISDIALFPHGMQGLRLWDADVVLSRFIILQNERFRNKSIFVFKAGVGIAGITMGKWGGCKNVVMCDTRTEVVGNMTRNCQRNGVSNVTSILINLTEFSKYPETYDYVLNTDLFSQGFPPQIILNIWRKVLKVGGQSIMILPEKKQEAKKLLQLVDRQEFKINNMILTADQYEVSPLFNKIQGESQFPLLGKTNFYAIILTKLKEKGNIAQKPQSQHSELKKPQQEKKVLQKETFKTPQRKNIQNKQQQPMPVLQRESKQTNINKNNQKNQKLNEKVHNKQLLVKKQPVKQIFPLSHQTHKVEQKKQQYQSPVRQLKSEEAQPQMNKKQKKQPVIVKQHQSKSQLHYIQVQKQKSEQVQIQQVKKQETQPVLSKENQHQQQINQIPIKQEHHQQQVKRQEIESGFAKQHQNKQHQHQIPILQSHAEQKQPQSIQKQVTKPEQAQEHQNQQKQQATIEKQSVVQQPKQPQIIQQKHQSKQPKQQIKPQEVPGSRKNEEKEQKEEKEEKQEKEEETKKDKKRKKKKKNDPKKVEAVIGEENKPVENAEKEEVPNYPEPNSQ